MGVVKLVSQISNNIIPEIQVERVDFGQYIATGVPEDYTTFVRDYLPITASKSEIQRVASLVRQDIEDYLNHIFSIGAKPLRYGQSMLEIFNKAMSLPISGSADDLTSDIADVLGMSIDSVGPEGQVISAIYEYKISGDMVKLQDSLKTLATTYPELVTAIDTLDTGAKIPAMSGETYETGSSMPNVPAMSGVNYEAGAGGLSIPMASKTIPLKKIGQDEYEGEEEEGEIPEFGEGPIKLTPEQDIEEYIEQQAEPGEEEEEELEGEFDAYLEDKNVNADELSADELEKLHQDFLDERKEAREPEIEKETEEIFAEPTDVTQEEQGPIDPRMERVQNLFGSLANEVGKQEKKPEKASSKQDMTNRWFNIIGHLPIAEQNKLFEMMGDKRTDQLDKDIVELGKVESADFVDFAKQTEKETAKTKGKIPTRLKYERRELDNSYIEDLANIYKDYFKDMSLSIAGMSNLGTAKTFIEQWATNWYPDIIEPMQQIARQTSLYNPEFLLQEVADWKQRIDNYRTAEEDVPDSLLAKIPSTIDIDTDLGVVKVPNPLFEQNPYSQYFKEEIKVPTGPPSWKAHPGTEEFWEKRLQPEPATGIEPARRVYEAEPLPYKEKPEEKNPYEKWLESIKEPVEKNIADFKQYLVDQGLDPTNMSRGEQAQALKDFRESRQPILSLDQIDQTLTYLADDIDMELKEAVGKPEKEYYSSLTRFVTDTRKDLQNIQTQLTSGYDYDDPNKVIPLIEKAKGVSDILDTLDADIKEYRGETKEKETSQTETEKLTMYEDEYRTLYTSRKHLEEDINKYNSYIRKHKDELQGAVDTYNGYKAELQPFMDDFNTYLMDKGLDPTSVEGAYLESQLLDYEKTLKPDQRGLFHNLRANMKNLEKEELRPLRDVHRAKQDIKQTQNRFDEVTDYLKENNVDVDKIVKQKVVTGPEEVKEVYIPARNVGEHFNMQFRSKPDAPPEPVTVVKVLQPVGNMERYIVELSNGRRSFFEEAMPEEMAKALAEEEGKKIPEKKERPLHKIDWETKEVKPTLDIGERYYSTTLGKPFTVLNVNPNETESRRYLVELDSGEKKYVGENLENIKRIKSKKANKTVPLKINMGTIPFTIGR